jgi:hypothetical protein
MRIWCSVFDPQNASSENRAPISSYHEGGSLRLVARLVNHLGEVLTPTTVRLALLPPEATIPIDAPVTYEGDSYVAVVSLDAPGLWRYAFQANNPAAVYESAFYVARRLVPAPE